MKKVWSQNSALREERVQRSLTAHRLRLGDDLFNAIAITAFYTDTAVRVCAHIKTEEADEVLAAYVLGGEQVLAVLAGGLPKYVRPARLRFLLTFPEESP